MNILKNQIGKYFVYALKDPRTGEPRYVGQTSSGMTRPLAHRFPSVLKKRTPHFQNWVNSLLKNGLMYEVIVLEMFFSSETLNAAEVKWISTLRSQGYKLINYTNGGGGIRGFHLSLSARQKIADSNRRRKGEKRNYERSAAQKSAVKLNQPKAAAARRGIAPSQAAIDVLTKVAKAPRSPRHRAKHS